MIGFNLYPDGRNMRTQSPKEITRLLVAWSDGDESALEGLTPLVYEELRRLAHHYMSRERPGHTLQTIALVNEAYLRLIDWKNVHWQSRAHFFAVSAQLMRRILVDCAQTRGYATRGGPHCPSEASGRELREGRGPTFAAHGKRADARPIHHEQADSECEDDAQRADEQAPIAGRHREKLHHRSCAAIHQWKASTT